MNERSVPTACDIHACPPDQLGIGAFHQVNGLLYEPRIANIDATVAVEVVHCAVSIVIDVDVRGIAVHVSAETGTASRVAAARVVGRSAKPAHDGYSVHSDALPLQLGENELE